MEVVNVPHRTLKQLAAITGGLSAPGKMPGRAYSLPADECKTGAKLRQVAGSTCEHCYAMSGRYAWKPIQTALRRRLTAIDHPEWVEAMAESIQRQSPEYFRWHDSGDLQSVEHLDRIVQVCQLTPDTRHWLPTREYRIVADWRRIHGDFPPNLNVRLSAHMIGGTIGHPKGLTISTVSRDGMPDSHECPARHQGNQCGDCRACWSKDVPHVDYRLHLNLTERGSA